MRSFRARSISHLVIGASALALAAPGVALAQDSAPNTAATMGNPGDSEIRPEESPPAYQDAPFQGDEIVVTGIRASLREAQEIKRNAQGVVDAISAEDIGKFPDTNLAESLQRITGVSIDRSNGEGSLVTVRGFGPEFNLVTLNGRQMPTSTLGDGASAPASRSFDFANLAAEGVAAVEVYKSGRATVPSGGIGSTINIRTPRPLDNVGFRGSVAAKAVYDSSMNGDDEITPEFSGIVSNTFANDTIGILLNGSYQRRKASTNTASVSWRDAFRGSDTEGWGLLPVNDAQQNRPTGDELYAIPQEASYVLNNIDRERINGQAVLQFRPIESLTATLDYTFSQNTVEVRNSSTGIWFNNVNVASAWEDGPVGAPVFYSESFGAGEFKDISYSGALTANRSINHSFGGNLTWEAPGGVTVTLDGHHSTAESKPTNDYGSSVSVGNAVFGVQNQRIDFTQYIPVISVGMYPGIDRLNTALITPTGNSFRNAYFKDEINQAQLRLHYDHEGSFLDSIDFGATYTENHVRSAYGFIQNETWGGAGPASDIPDDIFTLETLPDKFPDLAGSDDPAMIQSFYTFDFERMVDLIEDLYGVCSSPGAGSAQEGTCLADFTTDRRITEKTIAPYLQVNNAFDLFGNTAHLIAGLRYEHTVIDSAALVPIPAGTSWNSANEFSVNLSGESDFSRFKGEYENWLPNVDFDVSPIRDVKLRASYSHTITRADYNSLQGGLTVATNFRVESGDGNRGNPGLLPYKSKNIDLSAEWYYDAVSYISVGFFHKDVENFIGTDRTDESAFGLRTPIGGPRYNAALAALGADATPQEIRAFIFANYPNTVDDQGLDPNGNVQGPIFSLPEDPLLNFQINTPVNNDQTAKLHGWEFNIQHNFWDTGFGTILNYTIVNGDAVYDNTQPSSVTQFALTGLSDSANAVLYYDKGPFQARVAYNWRDEFLAQTGANPLYVEAYGQVDASASYEFAGGITAFAEVINLTGESRRGHRRSDHTVAFAQPGFARYSGGLRLTF